MKKYFEYFARKRGLRVVTVVIFILLGSALFLGVLSSREMKRMISKDFNDQQLGLARHAAGILTEDFKIIKKELLTLSRSPSIQHVEAVSWPERMKISLSSVGDYGVFQIVLINAAGTQSYSMNYNSLAYVGYVDPVFIFRPIGPLEIFLMIIGRFFCKQGIIVIHSIGLGSGPIDEHNLEHAITPNA